MRRVIGIALIATGTLLGVFVFNLIMFITVPAYHDTLTEAVTEENSIPVVIVENNSEQEEELSALENTIITDEVVPLSENRDEDTKASEEDSEEDLTVVDREYHEDCGTGEGYWVFTYSDGSVGVE